MLKPVVRGVGGNFCIFEGGSDMELSESYEPISGLSGLGMGHLDFLPWPFPFPVSEAGCILLDGGKLCMNRGCSGNWTVDGFRYSPV